MMPKQQIKSLSMPCDLITAKLNQEADTVHNDIVSWDTHMC